ncbi:MAG: polymer-forming cytoskeletal protein, partial [Gemmatimonadota bacterium]|nr:polymer-forming cytoskeletal protein [Gemmatimonadota bacterium]
MHAVRRLVTKLALLTPALVAPTLVATPRLIAAQDRPASTLWTAVNRYNASSTTRATGTYRLEAGARVSGDVAVLIGPVEIAGEITGTLVAINANVQLAPTAVIRGDLLILGGTLTRAEGA